MCDLCLAKFRFLHSDGVTGTLRARCLRWLCMVIVWSHFLSPSRAIHKLPSAVSGLLLTGKVNKWVQNTRKSSVLQWLGPKERSPHMSISATSKVVLTGVLHLEIERKGRLQGNNHLTCSESKAQFSKLVHLRICHTIEARDQRLMGCWSCYDCGWSCEVLGGPTSITECAVFFCIDYSQHSLVRGIEIRQIQPCILDCE